MNTSRKKQQARTALANAIEGPAKWRPTQCERCRGTGVTGHRIRTGTYVGPGPVPDDARGFVDATCDACRGHGYETGDDL